MSKPITKEYMGGIMKFIAKNDEYKDPSGSVKQYEKTKIMVTPAGSKSAIEITRNLLAALKEYMQEPEISEKLRDWV